MNICPGSVKDLAVDEEKPWTAPPSVSRLHPVSPQEDSPEQAARIRIGELSRRTGLSPDVLRVWERRYSLFEPLRTEGGFRLYSAADEARAAEMQRLLDLGYAASAAARITLAREAAPARGGDAEWTHRLEHALDAFDDRAADALLDRVLADNTLETVLRGLLAYLNRLGDRWAAGEATVAQEHFATSLLRGRLLSLARGWGGAVGPRAVLACPSGEQHDLGLICFGLCLKQNGWRIAYLGQDTPGESILETADALGPELVAIAVVDPGPLRAARADLARIAQRHRLVVCGAGVDKGIVEEIGGELEQRDPVTAAMWQAERLGAPGQNSAA